MRRAGAAVLLALSLLGPGGEARAEDAAGTAEGRISVVGRARSEVAPDFASVEIGVEAKGATPAAALDGASAAAKAILALAAEFKVPEADLGTSAVTLQPVTRSVRQADGSFTEKPDGYRAANTVRVRLADMGRLGDLMRRALDGGANRIDGVGFGLRDPDAAESAVRSAAMKDAPAPGRAAGRGRRRHPRAGGVDPVAGDGPASADRLRGARADARQARRRSGAPGRRHHRDGRRCRRDLRDRPMTMTMTTPAPLRILLVVAVALVDTDGRVLLAQRPPGKQLAGLWEFPGGKVEPGERPEETLIRELAEELGITVQEACLAPLTFASHAYPDFHLLMPLYICRRWEGLPRSMEGQAPEMGAPARPQGPADAAGRCAADPLPAGSARPLIQF